MFLGSSGHRAVPRIVAIHTGSLGRFARHLNFRIEQLQGMSNTSGGTTRTLNHVPALDGLRGVGVVAVLLFHQRYFGAIGDASWQGGFLGVDIFFVLSGYLITSLLLIEAEQTGRIAVVAFWSRRVRRLLPAVLVMLAVVAVFTRTLTNTLGVGNLRTESLLTLFYINNWHTPITITAVGHTWSLAVEEQWYLVWPIAAFFVLRNRANRTRQRLLPFVGMAILASTALTWWLFDRYGSIRAYAGTDARAQQLLIGVFVATAFDRRAVMSRRGQQIADVVGALCGAGLLILFSSARMTASWYFQGGMLIVAIFAGGMVVAATHGTVLARGLSLRPLRFVGLISYGVYLYHPPIFHWLTSHRTHLGNTSLFALRASATVAVAVASYYLLERPLRRSKVQGPRLWGCAALAIAITFGIVTVGTSGPTKVKHLSPIATLVLARFQGAVPPGTPTILVVGNTAATALQRLNPGGVTSKRIHGFAVGWETCGLAEDDIAPRDSVFGPVSKCATISAAYADAIELAQPDWLVWSLGLQELTDRVAGDAIMRNGSAESDATLLRRLDHLTRLAKNANADVAIMTPPCVDRTNQSLVAPMAHLRSLLAKYTRQHPSVRFLDWWSDLCAPGRDGLGLWWTNRGLSGLGAQRTWQWIEQQLVHN